MVVAPEISKEEAENIISAKKSFFPLKILKKHVLPKRMELIYLPFYLFDIFMEKERKKQKVILSVDGLLGNTVFFVKDNMNYEDRTDHPSCNFELSSAAAKKIVLDEYKRLLLEHGLRTRKFSKAEKISGSKKIFYPFWVVYLQKKKGYDFKALDAVSGEIQGVKMRKVFLRAFRQMS